MDQDNSSRSESAHIISSRRSSSPAPTHFSAGQDPQQVLLLSRRQSTYAPLLPASSRMLPGQPRGVSKSAISQDSQVAPPQSYLPNNHHVPQSGSSSKHSHSGHYAFQSPYQQSSQASYKSPYMALADKAMSPQDVTIQQSQLLAMSRKDSCSQTGSTYETMNQGTKFVGEYDFLNEYQPDDDDDLSDADSVSHAFRQDIEKYKKAVLDFRATRNESDDARPAEGSTRGRRRGGGKGSRGRYRPRGSQGGAIRKPRQAAPLTGDLKYRLAQASRAFIEERIDNAMELVQEIIRINAETFEAWMLLASCWQEKKEVERAMSALLFAAHLRMNEQEVWMNCARFALEAEAGDQRSRFLNIAKFCYSNVVRANPLNDVEGRIGKALVLREQSLYKTAIGEYMRVLNRRPHDLAVLRLMAETFIDMDSVEDAKKLYWQSIVHYKSLTGTREQNFGWSDVNIFVEIHGYLGQYSEAIVQLKSLSRWLLGRQDQEYWDKYLGDDREWDMDNDRRMEEPAFDVRLCLAEQHGAGLPLELRVKLGLFRLHLGDHEEAVKHVLCLDPENKTGEDMIVDYSDLFRDVADGLFGAKLFETAIVFYTVLQDRLDQEDVSISLQLGQCYLKTEQEASAEECFHRAAQIDGDNVDARMHLAKIYERQGDQEQAFVYVNEVMAIQRRDAPPARAPRRRGRKAGQPKVIVHRAAKPRPLRIQQRATDAEARRQQEEAHSKRLQQKYAIMRAEHSNMLAGHESSMVAWMEAAKEMIDDFRGFRAFFPWDKYVRFMGYSSRAKADTGAEPVDNDVATMAERLSKKLGSNAKEAVTRAGTPENYRGISFSSWLDIFLQYALCLTKRERSKEAYEICESASDAIIWYHSKEDMFLIKVCWCTCALFSGDEETCLQVSRHFTTDYQFSTDSYRMFSALSKLNRTPSSWYSAGPTQKYMLRQIKAMDYTLLSNEHRSQITEKASYSQLDSDGKPMINEDLDISLLMLYGHILAAGASYSFALNYFFRALALDPQNSMICLSIGLAYVHHALKRQADNRQYHIMQGLSFLFRYYDMRTVSTHIEERQEAHYCIARTYHVVGLTHLALPYYWKVLQEGYGESRTKDDVVRDAAYNIQTMYLSIGNTKLAKAVTQKWLVL